MRPARLRRSPRSEPHLPAAHRRAPGRPAGRRLGHLGRAVAATAVGVAVTALAMGPAGSQAPTGSSSSSSSTPTSSTGSAPTTGGAGSGSLTLVDQSAWVAPIGAYNLRVDAGSTLPADAQIQARIYVPISTQAQLDRAARGQSLGQRVESVTVPAAEVPRNPDGTLQLSYPMIVDGTRAPTGFQLANPGVYPFSLSVTDAGTTISQVWTQLIRLPEAPSSGSASTSSPLAVALVVPYGAAVAHRPDRAPTLSPTQLAALDAEADQLGQYPSVPVSLAPAPETIDTLADHDRTTGSHLLADLRTAIAHRDVLAGPYVNVDSGAWVAHGLATGYDQQLVAGAQALSQLGTTVDQTAAVADPDVSPDSLSQVIDNGAHVVVAATDRLAPVTTRAPADSDQPLTQWFDLAAAGSDHVEALPADSAMASTLDQGADPNQAAHQVLAALALVSLDHSGSQACIRQAGQPCRRGVVVQLPSDATRSQAVLSALLAALAAPTADGVATPLVQATSVSAFTSTVDPSSASDRTTTTGTTTLRHLDSRSIAGLGTYPRTFLDTTADIDSFRTMSTGSADDKASDLASAWMQVALASGSTQLDSAQATAWLADIRSDIDAQLSQVSALSQQTVTLTSASGKIPFSISNALDYPVKVLLDFQSPKLHFVNGNEQTVTIPAGQPAHLTIPVTVRASGAFPMQVTITSPDHHLPITRTRFDVRSTAISGIGLALTVAAGLFLALWWIRNARNTRRRKHLVASNHPVLGA